MPLVTRDVQNISQDKVIMINNMDQFTIIIRLLCVLWLHKEKTGNVYIKQSRVSANPYNRVEGDNSYLRVIAKSALSYVMFYS